jgi:hypothetical protein
MEPVRRFGNTQRGSLPADWNDRNQSRFVDGSAI